MENPSFLGSMLVFGGVPLKINGLEDKELGLGWPIFKGLLVSRYTFSGLERWTHFQ